MTDVCEGVSENERPKGFVTEVKPLMPQQLAPADVHAVPLQLAKLSFATVHHDMTSLSVISGTVNKSGERQEPPCQSVFQEFPDQKWQLHWRVERGPSTLAVSQDTTA